jgi:NAD(P)-dependent dehydrogenase (short-subunit alcohol dehydrogenase family)|tara:strand:+ start:353 stop:1072 length:720 start_codon:yes stop_codon:yes gene_type:complete
MLASTTKKLENRIALITGASRGIGAAVAKHFAAEGAHVILIARTIGGLERIDDEIKSLGGSATLLPCDLNDLDRIDNIGPSLLERFGRLDILIGNAAILGTMTPLTHYKTKSWEEVFDVNVHANWRLMRVAEPLLKLSDAGRAIFVTTSATKNPKAYWGAYAITKSALETMTKVWASELNNTSVRVNLLSPGPTLTKMRQTAFPGENPSTLKTPDTLGHIFLQLASPNCEAHGELIEFQ